MDVACYRCKKPLIRKYTGRGVLCGKCAYAANKKRVESRPATPVLCYRCGRKMNRRPTASSAMCGRCSYASNPAAVKSKVRAWVTANRGRHNETLRASYLARKSESVRRYGGKCPCGESNLAFLVIDHINDDGADDRRLWRNKVSDIHRFLKKNEYPPGYQVLCGSCNLQKEIDRRRRRGSNTWEHNQAAKLRVIGRYGGSCRCCGQTGLDKLVIDHINGGGSKEKATYPSRNVYLFLDGSLPDHNRFQVLCQNCNQAKASLGACPHSAE